MNWIPVLVLVAVFAAAAWLPVNMGLLALVATWGVGALLYGEAPRALLSGFPVDLLLTLLGVTYLFGVAQANGTVDHLVRAAVRMVGGRSAALGWVFFAVAGLLTAAGALGPAAVALIAPLALGVAREQGQPPLMMGLMVIHGTQAGAFAPGAVYGSITAEVAARTGLPLAPGQWFLASLAMNLLLAALVWAWARRWAVVAHPASPTAAAEATTLATTPAEAPVWRREHGVTLLGLLLLAVGVLLFKANTGLLALAVVAALAVLAPQGHRGALARVDWSTIVLICGVITYVALLERHGIVTAVGEGVAAAGGPLWVALLLCLLAGLVSAFASSTALLGVVIPLAVPVVQLGGLDGVGMVAALAVSTTIVDTSPFSTNGALVVAQAGEGQRDVLLRQLIGYSVLMVTAGCVLAWLLFVILPG
jgi:di/tricarboxylate transporter